MDWYLNIPKILYTYWGGKSMPYLRYKTLESFARLNPDWEVRFYYPEIVSNRKVSNRHNSFIHNSWDDYTKQINNLRVTREEVNFDRLGVTEYMTEVHKSDLLRLRLLYKYGGVWSDMDILYLKPITYLEVNVPENSKKETFVCISDYGHSIGFLMASQNNTVFYNLLSKAPRNFRSGKHQCMGSVMYNRYFRKLEDINAISPAVNIKMNAVYPHNTYNITEIYNDNKPNFTEHTIGLHWYGGDKLADEFLTETRGGVDNLPDNILGNLLRDGY